MKKGLSLNKSFLNHISQLIKKGRSFVVSRPGTVNATLLKPLPLKTDTGEQMVTKFLLSKFSNNNILWDARKVSSAKTSLKGLSSFNTMMYEVMPYSTQSSGELAHAVKNILPESPHLKIIKNNIIVLPKKEGSWKPKFISSARINRLGKY